MTRPLKSRIDIRTGGIRGGYPDLFIGRMINPNQPVSRNIPGGGFKTRLLGKIPKRTASVRPRYPAMNEGRNRASWGTKIRITVIKTMANRSGMAPLKIVSRGTSVATL